jgi:hypothetical protein
VSPADGNDTAVAGPPALPQSDPPQSDAARRLSRHGDFNRLWLADAVSAFGSQVTVLALPLTAVLYLHARARPRPPASAGCGASGATSGPGCRSLSATRSCGRWRPRTLPSTSSRSSCSPFSCCTRHASRICPPARSAWYSPRSALAGWWPPPRSGAPLPGSDTGACCWPVMRSAPWPLLACRSLRHGPGAHGSVRAAVLHCRMRHHRAEHRDDDAAPGGHAQCGAGPGDGGVRVPHRRAHPGGRGRGRGAGASRWACAPRCSSRLPAFRRPCSGWSSRRSASCGRRRNSSRRPDAPLTRQPVSRAPGGRLRAYTPVVPSTGSRTRSAWPIKGPADDGPPGLLDLGRVRREVGLGGSLVDQLKILAVRVLRRPVQVIDAGASEPDAEPDALVRGHVPDQAQQRQP